MADFTRKAIKETFITLLEERPLSEITVKDIVETCGINRNSFYYHYQDLPALIEEIVKEEVEGVIAKYPSVNTIVECFDAMIDFTSHRKKAVMHIYRSMSREVFERNMMDTSEYFIRNYVESAIPKDSIPAKDKETVITYYKCVVFGFIIDWLNNGMTEEYAQSIRRIFVLKKDLAVEIAQMLQGQI